MQCDSLFCFITIPIQMCVLHFPRCNDFDEGPNPVFLNSYQIWYDVYLIISDNIAICWCYRFCDN